MLPHVLEAVSYRWTMRLPSSLVLRYANTQVS
jgi:hypothetical protein